MHHKTPGTASTNPACVMGPTASPGVWGVPGDRTNIAAWASRRLTHHYIRPGPRPLGPSARQVPPAAPGTHHRRWPRPFHLQADTRLHSRAAVKPQAHLGDAPNMPTFHCSAGILDKPDWSQRRYAARHSANAQAVKPRLAGTSRWPRAAQTGSHGGPSASLSVAETLSVMGSYYQIADRCSRAGGREASPAALAPGRRLRRGDTRSTLELLTAIHLVAGANSSGHSGVAPASGLASQPGLGASLQEAA